MEEKEKAGFICTKGTLDGAYPALMLGLNAARQGMETKVFFSFMGINVLLKNGVGNLKFFPPGFMGAIPGMPSMATGIMKKKIAKANIPSLDEILKTASSEGLELVACKMTLDMMELSEDRLIDGVAVWEAEDFIKYAKECKLCLFT